MRRELAAPSPPPSLELHAPPPHFPASLNLARGTKQCMPWCGPCAACARCTPHVQTAIRQSSLEMAADLLADSDGILLCETGSGLGGFIATSRTAALAGGAWGSGQAGANARGQRCLTRAGPRGPATTDSLVRLTPFLSLHRSPKSPLKAPRLHVSASRRPRRPHGEASQRQEHLG